MSEHDLTGLGERALLDEFAALLRQDAHTTVRLLRYIDEIDERKLWAKHGHASMFSMCVERFHMSESTAAKRVWVARTARRFPLVLEMLARRELHLSGVMVLAKHLREENHAQLLGRARHRSRREIERLLATIAPRPDVRSRIRRLPSLPPVAETVCTGGSASPSSSALVDESQTTAGPIAERSSAPATTPLSRSRYKLVTTLHEATVSKLRQLQDLSPGADVPEILDAAFEALLVKKLARKASITDRPRTNAVAERDPPEKRSRAIPSQVKRAVWKRDQGRCADVSPDGRRCSQTRGLEFHHETPFARGGEHSVATLALRCRPHNQYEAELDFGRAFMDRKRRARDVLREAFTAYRRVGIGAG